MIQTGDLLVHLDTKSVEVNGQSVYLSVKEYQMLELLSLRKGTTLMKEMFLNHLYGGTNELPRVLFYRLARSYIPIIGPSGSR